MRAVQTQASLQTLPKSFVPKQSHTLQVQGQRCHLAVSAAWLQTQPCLSKPSGPSLSQKGTGKLFAAAVVQGVNRH